MHFGCSLKDECIISVCFQGKPFNITVIQVYAQTSYAEEAEVERFYEDLQDLLELTLKKRCPFHYMGLKCKTKKSRTTWSNRQIWPWSTEWNREKASRVLPRECTGHSKHTLPTTQEMSLYMGITRWSIPKSDWWYSLQLKLYTVSKNKSRSWLWLRSWTPYCKIQTSIEVGKTTRPFRYDLNQIPYGWVIRQFYFQFFKESPHCSL